VGKAWYLINLSTTADEFEAELSVRAPSTHHFVGQGAPTDRIENDDGTVTWLTSFQHQTEQLFVYASQGAELTSESGFPVTAYYASDEIASEPLSEAVNLAGEVIDFYNEAYVPLPVDEAHIMIMPYNVPFGGAGLLGNVFLADYVVGELDYLLEQGIAHEFGHSWWGGVASSVGELDGAFMHEAFAEYSAWRALGTLRGDAVRTAGMRMNAVWYMYGRPGDLDMPILDPATGASDVYVHVTYHKGPVVIRTFEELVGIEPFTEALRGLLDRGSGGLTVDALVEEVEAVSGVDLSFNVNQWLKQRGFPSLVVSGEIEESSVTVEVESDGAFTYQLPLQFVMTDGSVVEEKMDVEDGTTTGTFELDEAPVLVQVDPRWTLVREVTPALSGDVTFDGVVDAHDLIEVALMSGGELPAERRVDGSYDPLYDINGDGRIDESDLDAMIAGEEE